MKEIEGISTKEVLEQQRQELIEYYNFCNSKLQELRNHEREIETIRKSYLKLIAKYRIDSVLRVLDYIRNEYRQGREVDIETLLCHCQNKLLGNIDGTEIEFK